jgi:hypothetical protein
LDPVPVDSVRPAAATALAEATSLLTRLIPFPGASEVLSALPIAPLRLGEALPGAGQLGVPQLRVPPPFGGGAPEAPSQQAPSLVSQAAAILDEEMARGVLAARSASPAAQYQQPYASSPLLRQMHELVDSVARVWPGPSVAAVGRPAVSQSAGNDLDPLAELRPWSTVRPGQRATIAMALCNKEDRAVRLVPVVTDLLGSRGGRIVSSTLELTPSEICLEPQEQKEVGIAMMVPVDTPPGCYSGVLVASGVDYLRALITIEVV